MESIKIIMPTTDKKPGVCGATLQLRRDATDRNRPEVWLCSRHCGARGFTYEGALRRKVRLDLLSWGDIRRNAQTLIAAESDHPDSSLLQ